MKMLFSIQKVMLFLLFPAPFFCCNVKNFKINDNDQASLWVNRLQTSYLSIEKYNVEEIAFSIIPANYKNEYINRLENAQYVVLEKDEYLNLTKKELEKKYGLAIRAVYAHSGGDFDLIRNNMNGNNIFLVHYFVMGSSVSEINKEVLIIEVDELPEEIFVGYTVVK